MDWEGLWQLVQQPEGFWTLFGLALCSIAGWAILLAREGCSERNLTGDDGQDAALVWLTVMSLIGAAGGYIHFGTVCTQPPTDLLIRCEPAGYVVFGAIAGFIVGMLLPLVLAWIAGVIMFAYYLALGLKTLVARKQANGS